MEHDIHVGVVEVEISDREIEITVKTFLDDLQLACGLETGGDLPAGYTSADEMISSYIDKSLSIELNNSQVELKVEDIAAAQDAVWITLTGESLDLSAANHLSIRCNLLTATYDDQQNIIKLMWGDKKKSKVLDRKDTTFDWSR